MSAGKTDNDCGAATNVFDPAEATDETERHTRNAIESFLILIQLSQLITMDENDFPSEQASNGPGLSRALMANHQPVDTDRSPLFLLFHNHFQLSAIIPLRKLADSRRSWKHDGVLTRFEIRCNFQLDPRMRLRLGELYVIRQDETIRRDGRDCQRTVEGGNSIGGDLQHRRFSGSKRDLRCLRGRAERDLRFQFKGAGQVNRTPVVNRRAGDGHAMPGQRRVDAGNQFGTQRGSITGCR